MLALALCDRIQFEFNDRKGSLKKLTGAESARGELSPLRQHLSFKLDLNHFSNEEIINQFQVPSGSRH
jgi:hypothetical protein